MEERQNFPKKEPVATKTTVSMPGTNNSLARMNAGTRVPINHPVGKTMPSQRSINQPGTANFTSNSNHVFNGKSPEAPNRTFNGRTPEAPNRMFNGRTPEVPSRAFNRNPAEGLGGTPNGGTSEGLGGMPNGKSPEDPNKILNGKATEELNKLNSSKSHSNKSKRKLEKVAGVFGLVFSSICIVLLAFGLVSTMNTLNMAQGMGIGAQAVRSQAFLTIIVQAIAIVACVVFVVLYAQFVKTITKYTDEEEKRDQLRDILSFLSILTVNLPTFIMLLRARKLADDYPPPSEQRMDLEDLEAIHEQNLRSFRTHSTRNRVAIIILSILLAIAIAVLCSYLGILYLENNVFLHVHGNVNAKFIVDGVQMNRFRTPKNITGNSTLIVDTNIKIESRGTYNVEFEVFVYQNNVRIENTVIVETFSNQDNKFEQIGYCRYRSMEAVSGGRTIDLFEGIVLDRSYKDSLNVDNVRIEIRAYFTKV